MDIKACEEEYFFKTYKRLDIEIAKGEGCWLISKTGERYLDLFGGLAVNSLGYNHPKINEAIRTQIEKYIHLSNLFLQESQVSLAELLIKNSGYKKIFFSNSGTEAMEGTIKLARKWGKNKGKSEIISFHGSFHGRTMGALSITGREKYRNGYEPFLQGSIFSTYNDSQELISKVNEKTLAIVLEFIQGEGGINEANAEFIKTISDLREKFGVLLIADEIQSGLGRTGKFFAFNHLNIAPDVVVIAKPLGGGLPLGAFLGNERVADVFTYGVHGTTFGGNPVACSAGIATIKEIVENGEMQNAENIGSYLKYKFNELKLKYPNLIQDVRGRGCMLGVELKREGELLVTEMLKKKVLINCTNTNVIRLLPPFILTKDEADFALDQFDSVFSTLNK
ncbi:MAG: aspartate aminotransferase family protein [Bacteroidota bacterium]|nr:aspartate aminotransferase family protein [Bacteroidota bacterium]